MPNWFKQNSNVFIWGLITVLICLGCNEQKPTQQEFSPIAFNNPVRDYGGMSRLFVAKDGLYMSWIEQLDSLSTLKYAKYNGANWSAPATIASGTDWFVNWADFPAIAVNKGNIFAHYLQKSAPGTYTYDIKYTVYNTATKAWSQPKKLHSDTTKSEHGFVSVIPYKDGFMASWLDGRTTVNVPDSLKQMTLRAGIVNPDASLGDQWELDKRVCDCCATAITSSPEGPIVVYRDRSASEIRDIYQVQLRDTVWTAPKMVYNDNWQINGCPVNGPAIVSNYLQTGIAWFTAAKDSAKVKLQINPQQGANVSETILVAQDEVMGRVDLAINKTGDYYITWMSSLGDVALINLGVYSKHGQENNRFILAETSIERSSGFPKIAIYKDNLYVSYTESLNNNSQIKTIKIPTNQIQFLN